MNEMQTGLFALTVVIAGFALAYLYGRNTKQFRWSEYVALITPPILSVLILANYYGIYIWKLFFASAIAGFILEYTIGFMYHKVLNKRLWTYARMSVHGYTSWLSVPLWGVGGVFFWILSRALGI